MYQYSHPRAKIQGDWLFIEQKIIIGTDRVMSLQVRERVEGEYVAKPLDRWKVIQIE